MNDNFDRFFTARELSKYLNLPIATVWKYARTGAFPSYRLPGGRRFIRFDLEEVMEVLEKAGGQER